MKNLSLLISSMAFFIVFSITNNAIASIQDKDVKDTIQILADPELFEIASIWVNEYIKEKPEINVKVIKIHPKNQSIAFEQPGNIGLITKDYLSTPGIKPSWKMAVGRDIIVPVTNAENPFLEEILQKGISPEEFAYTFTNTDNPLWGSVLNNNLSTIPIKCYWLNDETNQAYLSKFFKSELSKIKGKVAGSTEAILNEIYKDKYAIGFCRLTDIIDTESEEIHNRLSLIPIDINGNDKIDHFENIYTNSNTLERGIWIGKYPKVLYNSIYLTSGNQPKNNKELAFIAWTLNEGQQYLNAKGYSKLSASESAIRVQSLYANLRPAIEISKPFFTLTSSIVIILGGVLIVLFALKFIKPKKKNAKADILQIPRVFKESSVSAPNGYFFDKSHTWAFMEQEGDVRIGITDFLQHTTGKITKVYLKNTGESVKKGDAILTLIQDGKQLNIHSPISGKIKDINTKLYANASFINSAPYTQGWVYMIESDNWLKEIKSFLMGESYKAWLANEFYRLKHFFASTIKPVVSYNLLPVIQDGGEIIDNPLESFGPEVWEEFQIVFINRKN